MPDTHVTFLPLAAKSSPGEPNWGSRFDAREKRIMLNRLSRGILAAAVAVLLLLPLDALARQPFDAKAFEQAQAAGKTVLIDVYASWCPVCKKQQPTIARLEKEKPGLVVYEVNFDNDKNVLKKFGVQAQATLIVFKGVKEVGRSTGESDPGRIQALVEKGL
jgi:thioredoxin 1